MKILLIHQAFQSLQGAGGTLADAVVWMFENQEEATAMGVSGCQYVADNFNRENDARDFCDLIEKVLAK